MTNQTQTDPDGNANHVMDETRPFGRMLVAIDESPAADAAVRLVDYPDVCGCRIRGASLGGRPRRQSHQDVRHG